MSDFAEAVERIRAEEQRRAWSWLSVAMFGLVAGMAWLYAGCAPKAASQPKTAGAAPKLAPEPVAGVCRPTVWVVSPNEFLDVFECETDRAVIYLGASTNRSPGIPLGVVAKQRPAGGWGVLGRPSRGKFNQALRAAASAGVEGNGGR